MVTIVASSTTISWARLTTARIIHSWGTGWPYSASSKPCRSAVDGVTLSALAISAPSWATRSEITTLGPDASPCDRKHRACPDHERVNDDVRHSGLNWEAIIA